jgi:predicted lipid-binding transport protein (Tim44 family)
MTPEFSTSVAPFESTAFVDLSTAAQSDNPNNTSVLIGGIVGGIIALILIIALIAFIVMRNRRAKADNKDRHSLQSSVPAQNNSTYGPINIPSSSSASPNAATQSHYGALSAAEIGPETRSNAVIYDSSI